MKVGFQFKLNNANCIVCDIKDYEGKKYANICIENGEKIDYKIVELKENSGKIEMPEIKDEKLLDEIMPLFIFAGVRKKGESEKQMIDKYLPIGTVVLLKNAQKRIMITGFACKSPQQPNQTFDYCGCLYPEGMINSNQNMLFNHSQIETIYFLGYNDEESKEFQTKLKDIINNPN